MPPPALGTINGFAPSWCIILGKVVRFNGTTLGLTAVARANGAAVGNIVRADFGGGYRSYRLVRDTSPYRSQGYFMEGAGNARATD